MAATKLENLLNNQPGGSLEKIVRRAKKMDELTGLLRAALPAEVAENLVAANIGEDGELVVVANSPAWASRLRFENDALIEAAREAGEHPSRCRVRVCR